MARINKFEDLDCWKEARNLTSKTYRIAKKMAVKKDFKLAGQLTGASLSIMNNIAEGFGNKSNAEFLRFLIYSRRSCCEVQNCLYVAMDQQYLNNIEFQKFYDHASNVRKLIDGLIPYLKKQTN